VLLFLSMTLEGFKHYILRANRLFGKDYIVTFYSTIDKNLIIPLIAELRLIALIGLIKEREFDLPPLRIRVDTAAGNSWRQRSDGSHRLHAQAVPELQEAVGRQGCPG
jgi:hypothetical protein